jgi:hypothetical protein
MNWTGGKLQRSKQVKKGIVQMQKAHFARARTQLQNNSNSRTRPSFSRDDKDGPGGQFSTLSSRTVHHTGHREKQQEGRSKVDSASCLHGAEKEVLETVPVRLNTRKGNSTLAAYESGANSESAWCP